FESFAQDFVQGEEVFARQGARPSRPVAQGRLAARPDLDPRHQLAGIHSRGAPPVAGHRAQPTGSRRSGVCRLHLNLERSPGLRLKRGEIWTISGSDYAGKPRPAVILQDDRFASTYSITLCPLTTNP